MKSLVLLAAATSLLATSALAGETVNVGPFRNIELRGGGQVALHRGTQPVAVSGGGGITGSADLPVRNLNAAVEGGGHIDMRAVHADSANAAVNGGGHIQLYAAKSLHAAVSGGGRIEYWGNPQVTSAISGGGDVRQGS